MGLEKAAPVIRDGHVSRLYNTSQKCRFDAWQVAHSVLAIVTCGLWLPIWFIHSAICGLNYRHAEEGYIAVREFRYLDNEHYYPPAFESEVKRRICTREEVICCVGIVLEKTSSVGTPCDMPVLVVTNVALRFFFVSRVLWNVVSCTGDAIVLWSDVNHRSFDESNGNVTIRWKHGSATFSVLGDTARLMEEIVRAGSIAHHTFDASPADELGKLWRLVEVGALSVEEWDRAKQMYLGKPQDKKFQAIDLIEKLFGLQQAGALSESEFNMKKWDILSRNN